MKKLLLGTLLIFSMSAVAEFDLAAFENDLDIAIEKAGITTDLYFACSAKGKVETGKMISAIKEKSRQLPVDNADELAEKIETDYKEIFSCENSMQEAIAAGLSDEEIDQAINRVEEAPEVDPSGFDLEAFKRDLDETLGLN